MKVKQSRKLSLLRQNSSAAKLDSQSKAARPVTLSAERRTSPTRAVSKVGLDRRMWVQFAKWVAASGGIQA
jgi:hypothetical protein